MEHAVAAGRLLRGWDVRGAERRELREWLAAWPECLVNELGDAVAYDASEVAASLHAVCASRARLRNALREAFPQNSIVEPPEPRDGPLDASDVIALLVARDDAESAVEAVAAQAYSLATGREQLDAHVYSSLARRRLDGLDRVADAVWDELVDGVVLAEPHPWLHAIRRLEPRWWWTRSYAILQRACERAQRNAA